MDKSYLLHNLKIVDNAEEDHGMLDLEFQNIHYEGNDLIADVIETARYIGEVNPGTFAAKHENVSLTGAGGPVLQDFKIVTITTINNSGSSKSVTCPKLTLDPPVLGISSLTIPTGTSEFHTIVPTAAGYTTMNIAGSPTYSSGIEKSGPMYQVLPEASNETLTWG